MLQLKGILELVNNYYYSNIQKEYELDHMCLRTDGGLIDIHYRVQELLLTHNRNNHDFKVTIESWGTIYSGWLTKFHVHLFWKHQYDKYDSDYGYESKLEFKYNGKTMSLYDVYKEFKNQPVKITIEVHKQ